MADTDITEIDALKTLLSEDWRALYLKGDKCDDFETVDTIEGFSGRWHMDVDVITRGPSGQLYKWSILKGLTERQESELLDWDKDWVQPVTAVEKIVTEVTYVAA